MQAAFLILAMLPFDKGRLLARLLPFSVVLMCLAASVIRIPYYAMDPFSWNGIINPCAVWTIDYLSTLLVGAAYMLLFLQWLDVLKSFLINSGVVGKLVLVLRVIVVATVIALFVAVLPAACVTACYCDDTNCSLGASVSDFIFFIS